MLVRRDYLMPKPEDIRPYLTLIYYILMEATLQKKINIIRLDKIVRSTEVFLRSWHSRTILETSPVGAVSPSQNIKPLYGAKISLIKPSRQDDSSSAVGFCSLHEAHSSSTKGEKKLFQVKTKLSHTLSQ